jgi:hypothetical protein
MNQDFEDVNSIGLSESIDTLNSEIYNRELVSFKIKQKHKHEFNSPLKNIGE